MGQQLTQSGQLFGPHGVGEQSVVTDTMEAVRQYVNEKAADELVRVQCQGLVAIRPLGTIILPLEGDAAFISGEQAAVTDGDPMGVARQIGEHGLRPGERPLGIDHPVDLA